MDTAALELEDDVFFKDLSKQISLLIMDDDEGAFDDPLSHCPSMNPHAIDQAILPSAQVSYINYNQETNKRGTGVFIPLSMNPRRKNAKQQGRFNATSGNKLQRHCDHSLNGLPQRAYYANNIDHSSNPRRF